MVKSYTSSRSSQSNINGTITGKNRVNKSGPGRCWNTDQGLPINRGDPVNRLQPIIPRCNQRPGHDSGRFCIYVRNLVVLAYVCWRGIRYRSNLVCSVHFLSIRYIRTETIISWKQQLCIRYTLVQLQSQRRRLSYARDRTNRTAVNTGDLLYIGCIDRRGDLNHIFFNKKRFFSIATARQYDN